MSTKTKLCEMTTRSTLEGARLLRLTVQMLVMLFGASQGAWADDFLQNSSNFTAMIVGTDKVQFTLPTQYDGNLNEGISDGQVQISIDGGSYQSFIDWKVPSYRDLTSDEESGKCQIKGYLGGTYQLTGKVTGGYKTFGTSTFEYTLSWDDNNHDHFTTTVVWTAPRNLRGRKLTFRCKARSDDRDNHWYMPSENGWKTLLTWDCPPAAAVSVQLGEPMLAYEGEHINQQMFTYSVNARSIVWAKLYYTDALTGQKYTQDLDKTKLVGTLYIPADRPWRDVYVEAHVYDAEGKEVDTNIKSEARTTLMMHYPQDFFASIDNTGNALLTWSINNADLEDMLDGDYFEIQRNVSGSDARIDPGWTTITAAIPYEQGKRRYSFTDETLLSQYQGQTVSYRIRRTYTGMWQWAEQSGAATCQVNSLMALPSIASATVKKTSTWNDDSHVAQFAFTLTQSDGSKWDAQGRYLLNTEEDFAAFAALVNNGQTGLNAIMQHDIDISAVTAMIGYNSERPYKGTFDGNGHTLTVGYNTTEQFTAPIRYAAGATIKNLCVAGKLTSKGKFVAGIVGTCSSGTNTISNCRVSATIDSSISGDATNGGFVGTNGSGSTLNITDCLFDGRFTGSNCYANGGFVGWNDGNTNLKNCFYNGSNSTKLTGCHTFARSRDANKVTLTNCYYYDTYDENLRYNGIYIDNKFYYIIRNADDWVQFRSAVESAKGNSDVNAILAADISVSSVVGMDAWPYRGIFDGNGHTISVSTNWGSNLWAALFPKVKDCTIKNLHVKASITGGLHSAGLIGGVIGSPTVNIYRCWVSGDITSTSTHVGGFFGHTGSCTVNMEDCRFDGTLRASGTSYGGAILGWGAYEAHWNVSRVYEHGNYPNISHAGFCYYYNGGAVAWGNGTLCISGHNWGEVKSEYRNLIYGDRNKVVSLMNGGKSNSWSLQKDLAAPVMDAERTFLNATGCRYMGSSVASKLGGQWQVVNNTAVPKMTQTEPTTGNTTVWDKRARLLLRVNMHGE
ncbi:MAG: hypothetical protein IJ635_05470, partial [Bacteroidaceae bacterium]|nr:hypothetical protein [Bacteroidaceae bacterium]